MPPRRFGYLKSESYPHSNSHTRTHAKRRRQTHAMVHSATQINWISIWTRKGELYWKMINANRRTPAYSANVYAERFVAGNERSIRFLLSSRTTTATTNRCKIVYLFFVHRTRCDVRLMLFAKKKTMMRFLWKEPRLYLFLFLSSCGRIAVDIKRKLSSAMRFMNRFLLLEQINIRFTPPWPQVIDY